MGNRYNLACVWKIKKLKTKKISSKGSFTTLKAKNYKIKNFSSKGSSTTLKAEN
jgi:hypothetical protein